MAKAINNAIQSEQDKSYVSQVLSLVANAEGAAAEGEADSLSVKAQISKAQSGINEQKANVARNKYEQYRASADRKTAKLSNKEDPAFQKDVMKESGSDKSKAMITTKEFNQAKWSEEARERDRLALIAEQARTEMEQYELDAMIGEVDGVDLEAQADAEHTSADQSFRSADQARLSQNLGDQMSGDGSGDGTSQSNLDDQQAV